MPTDPPIRLRDAIVDPRGLIREYLVIVAIAAITVAVAVDAPNAVSVGIALVAAAFALFALAAALPGSITLTLGDAGLEVVAFFVVARRIPWSAVGAIEVAEGWQGETVAIEVGGEAGERVILGLPLDPTLGRRAFVTTFGLTPADLRARIVDRRDAVRYGDAGAAARRRT